MATSFHAPSHRGPTKRGVARRGIAAALAALIGMTGMVSASAATRADESVQIVGAGTIAAAMADGATLTPVAVTDADVDIDAPVAPTALLAQASAASYLTEVNPGDTPYGDQIVAPGYLLTGVLGAGPVILAPMAAPDGSGRWVWCIMAGKGQVNGSSGATVMTWEPDGAVGFLTDWIQSKYKNKTSGELAADPEARLNIGAIGYGIHLLLDQGNGAGISAEERRAAFAAANAPAIQARWAELYAWAQTQAGPYKNQTNVQTYDLGTLRTGVVSGVGIRSNSTGVWYGGVPFTQAATNAVWDHNCNGVQEAEDTAVWSGTTTDSEPADRCYLTTKTGNIEIGAPVFDRTYLKNHILDKFISGGELQDTIGAPSDPVQVQNLVGISFWGVAGFKITGTSQVVDKTTDSGEPVCDTLTVSLRDGYEWAELESGAVTVPLVATATTAGTRPAVEGDSPDSSTVVEEVRVSVTGEGEVTACLSEENQNAYDPGSINWQWASVRADMATDEQDYLLEDWSDAFALADETSYRRHDTVDVASSLVPEPTKNGVLLVEQALVSGFPDDHGQIDDALVAAGFSPDNMTMTVRWLFFEQGLDVTDENVDQAQVLGEKTVPATNDWRDDLLPSGGLYHPRDEDGNDVPGVSVVQWEFTGDDRVKPYTSSVEDVHEQYAPPAPDEIVPDVRTEIQADGEFVVGQEVDILDNVIAEAPEGVDGDITEEDGWTVDVDFFEWEGDTPVCSDDTLIGSAEEITLTGWGRYPSSSITVTPSEGHNTGAQETLRNKDGQIVSRGICGADSETLTPRQADSDTGQAAADSDAGLAVTGVQIGAVIAAALALVAAGVVAVWLRRRRAVPAGAGAESAPESTDTE